MNMAPMIPIVFVAINYDPVARGYVRSFARPGGNVTGVYLRALDLVGKELELLHQTVPSAHRLGVLWETDTGDEFAEAQRSAKALGLQVTAGQLQHRPYGFHATLERVAQSAPGVLFVVPGPNSM